MMKLTVKKTRMLHKWCRGRQLCHPPWAAPCQTSQTPRSWADGWCRWQFCPSAPCFSTPARRFAPWTSPGQRWARRRAAEEGRSAPPRRRTVASFHPQRCLWCDLGCRLTCFRTLSVPTGWVKKYGLKSSAWKIPGLMYLWNNFIHSFHPLLIWNPPVHAHQCL